MGKIITPGQNSAETTTETMAQDASRVQESNMSLRRAGHLCQPFGAQLVGSVAIHFYVIQRGDDKHRFATIDQCLIKGIDEGLADYGHKQLKKTLMKAYGRTPRE